MTAKRRARAVPAFAGAAQGCLCGRCGRACRVAVVGGSKSRMLKRAGVPKGLCVDCAVHDTLRNLYPVNMILARSGPQGLELPHVQRQFYDICRIAGTDAAFEEIDWRAVIDNWELPFPTKLKRTATNPVSQEELDREAEEAKRVGPGGFGLTEQELRAKAIGEADYFQRQGSQAQGEASP